MRILIGAHTALEITDILTGFLDILTYICDSHNFEISVTKLKMGVDCESDIELHQHKERKKRYIDKEEGRERT